METEPSSYKRPADPSIVILHLDLELTWWEAWALESWTLWRFETLESIWGTDLFQEQLSGKVKEEQEEEENQRLDKWIREEQLLLGGLPDLDSRHTGKEITFMVGCARLNNSPPERL